jgi:hypothetical protein
MTRALAVNGIALPGSGGAGSVIALACTLVLASVRPVAGAAAPATA